VVTESCRAEKSRRLDGPDKANQLRVGPVVWRGRAADELLDHLPGLIDDVSFRNFVSAETGGKIGVRVPFGLNVELEALDEIRVELRVLVDAHADHDNPGTGQILLQLGERGSFFDARLAPGCPKIQNQGFPAKIFGRNGLSLVGRNGEVGRHVAGHDHVVAHGFEDDDGKRAEQGRHHHPDDIVNLGSVHISQCVLRD